MDDNPDMPADADGPEVRVFCSFQFVELQTWMGGVQLKVERSCFCSFLLVSRQSGEAIREGVRDSEFHLDPI
jgi:hypothetical protein